MPAKDIGEDLSQRSSTSSTSARRSCPTSSTHAAPRTLRELQQRLRERRLHRTVAIPHDDQLAAMVDTGTYEHDALARTTRTASSGPGSRSQNA